MSPPSLLCCLAAVLLCCALVQCFEPVVPSVRANDPPTKKDTSVQVEQQAPPATSTSTTEQSEEALESLSSIPSFEVSPEDHSNSFWSARKVEHASKAAKATAGTTREKRGLGELYNAWQYSGNNMPRMTLNELHVALSFFNWFGQQRIGGGANWTLTDAEFFPNKVWPAVDAAKWLSVIMVNYGVNDTVFFSSVQQVHNFSCDLDWSQRDPDAEWGYTFTAFDGWCATNVTVVWGFGQSTTEVIEYLQANFAEELSQMKWKQIDCSCTLEGSSTFWCACIFAELQQVLFDACSECCSPDAC